MNWDFLTYIKKNWVVIIIIAVLFSWLYFFKHDDFAFILVGLGLFDLVKGYFQYKKSQSFVAELKENGLTEEIANNHAFVEKWNKISKKGIYRYCLFEGGILLGVELALLFGFIGLFLLTKRNAPLAAEDADILQYILICYLIGAMFGVAGARYLWSINQRKLSILKMQLNNEQGL